MTVTQAGVVNPQSGTGGHALGRLGNEGDRLGALGGTLADLHPRAEGAGTVHPTSNGGRA